jgi:hypothetical protein
MTELAPAPKLPEDLVAELRELISAARHQAAVSVNRALTVLYWRVGHRIRRNILGKERAGYGQRILATLSQVLVAEFGRGFEVTNLTRMMRFAEVFPEEEIVATLSQQLSWSHFRELLPLEQPLKREFYAEMSRVEGWSVRTLRGRIDSMLYERTALSKKPEDLARQELATLHSKGEWGPALVLKDPYILDFLELLTFWSSRTAILSGTSKTRFCASLRPFCSKWERGSLSSPGRNGSNSTERTSTSICCSTTASSSGWLRSI